MQQVNFQVGTEEECQNRWGFLYSHPHQLCGVTPNQSTCRVCLIGFRLKSIQRPTYYYYIMLKLLRSELMAILHCYVHRETAVAQSSITTATIKCTARLGSLASVMITVKWASPSTPKYPLIISGFTKIVVSRPMEAFALIGPRFNQAPSFGRRIQIKRIN